jgi:CRP-like cAMP-binding protein
MTNNALNGNRLLSMLPRKEARTLKQHLNERPLPQAELLQEANRSITHVYFITRGVVSLVKRLEAGEIIEIATVGPEGMIGTTLGLGSDSVDHRAIVQVPGEALCMEARTFKRVVKVSPKLQKLLMRYTVALLNQVAQSAACNRVHTVDERCARWLLMTHDRVKSDTFQLTQEFLAQMLGVHRPTVSVAAAMLQKAGYIHYVRGTITVQDRKGLERASCGCYRSISNEYERLLNDRSIRS